MAIVDPEILVGRRAFPQAQVLLAGAAARRLPGRVPVGWYGTETHPEAGAFAVVRDGWGIEGLIGRVLKITVGSRSIFVYVVGARDVPADVAVTRRAFLGLGLLAQESLPAVVEVVE